MRILFFVILLIVTFSCKKKNNQNIFMTPRNDELRIKMKSWDCECLYDEVKNRFFYNRNTGLFFGGYGYADHYKDCYDKLGVDGFKELYGHPHFENHKSLYYFCNVRYCGQYFDGLKFEKGEKNEIVSGMPYVEEDIFSEDISKRFNVRCRSVDYIDEDKMRINQGFFKYFDDDFVKNNFEAANYIHVQPKYENDTFSQRCLESTRYRQYNFIYNKRLELYMGNYTPNSQAFPLMGYGETDYGACQFSFNKPEHVASAFGEPSYVSNSKDTIIYILRNKLIDGQAHNRSYIWNTKYQAYIRTTIYWLGESYLPKVKNDCDGNPVP